MVRWTDAKISNNKPKMKRNERAKHEKRASSMMLLFVVSYIELSYLKILQAFIGFYIHLYCSLTGLVQQRKNPTANDFPFAFTRRINILYSFPFYISFCCCCFVLNENGNWIYILSSVEENETLFKIQNKT